MPKNKREILAGALLWVGCNCAVSATMTVEEANRLLQTGHVADAVVAYRMLVAATPEAVDLRLKYADALTVNRDWEKALAEYREVLKRDTGNSEAKRSMGSLQRWRGNIAASEQNYLSALQQNPQDLSAQLGLASTYRQDHDFANADRVYLEAEQQYPDHKDIERNRYAYQRQKNPRIYVSYQSGITSENFNSGIVIPFASREEAGVEYQQEIRPDIYTRTDNKVLYKHFFGFRHSLDFRYRNAEFSYDIPVSAYATIDAFDELRLRYTFPLSSNHIGRIRYTWRPTTLKISGDKFESHKVEAELRSFWNARLNTTIGGGWLRDLPEDAKRTSELHDNSLTKLGIEYWANNDWVLSAKYITNPDLDNSADSTQILQVNYSINGAYSLLGRYKIDDYKITGDETSYYAGLLYSPNQHLWSEFGAKYATRDGKDGYYPFVSVVWRF